MSHVISHQSQQKPATGRWKKCKNTLSEDALVRSFLNSVGLGEIKYSKILSHKLKTNLAESLVVVEKIIEGMGKLNFPVIDVFLWADSAIDFTAFLVVDGKDFVDEEFLKVMALCVEIEDQHKNENFYISHFFLPQFNSVKKTSNISAGYDWKYEKKPGTSNARRS